MSNPCHQAEYPVTVLAGPYGHPIHPILVTVPIGAWIASLVFDVASHIVAQPGFLAQGSLWLIAVEMDPRARAPILRRYLALAPGARPHIPVDRRAPLEKFDEIAAQIPVFHITVDPPRPRDTRWCTDREPIHDVPGTDRA